MDGNEFDDPYFSDAERVRYRGNGRYVHNVLS